MHMDRDGLAVGTGKENRPRGIPFRRFMKEVNSAIE